MPDEAALDTAALARAIAPVSGRLIVLFGSVVAGRPFPWSDVDIGTSGCDFWEGLRIGAALGRVLGREPHVVDLDRASDWLRFEVAREGAPIWQRDADTWQRFQAEAATRWFDVGPLVRRCAEGARRRWSRDARHA
jgi:predicted nucleotidyltransferase